MKIVGLPQTMRWVTGIQRQVQFATAQALNDTARDVQQFTTQKRLPQVFTLRAKGAPWWRPGTKFGFNIAYATKQRQFAVIGSRADWLQQQEFGGLRRTPSGHRMPIPTEQWKPKKAIMQRNKKPGRILKRGGAGLVAKPFVIGQAIYARTSAERGPLQRLFTLKNATRIRAVLQYQPRAMEEARRVYRRHYDQRLTYAILTAK